MYSKEQELNNLFIYFEDFNITTYHKTTELLYNKYRYHGGKKADVNFRQIQLLKNKLLMTVP